MTGERDLPRLLANMQPVLNDGVYVFATLNTPSPALIDQAICLFRETEGTTLILKRETAAAHGLETVYPSRMITLNVHSALEAVGFIAAISNELARAGISANPVSAFHHDHLFVPEALAAKAMQTLQAMSARV